MSHWIAYSLIAAIAGTIVLTTSVTKMRLDETVVATIQTRAGKKATLDLAATLERDMRNIGSNFPTYDLEPDSTGLTWVTDSTYNYFQFLGQAVPGQPPALIRYVWTAVDSTKIEGELKPLHQVSRYVNGVLAGRSPGIFTGVSFDFQDDWGQPAEAPEEMRQIKIELKAISALGSSSIVRETRWGSVYRPQALVRHDGDSV